MTPTERDELLLRLLAKNEERLEAIESRLPTPSNLEDHTEHHQWIQLAIRREAQAIALRQSIIDKTLTGLIWAGLLGLGAMFMSYLKVHGWKE